LINNAGFGGRGKFHERDWETDLAMIKLNVIALTAFTRHFLPDFVERNEGKIMNTSSTAALMPGPLQAVYYASKAYVTSFSNAIAEELSDTNVTVTAFMPGVVDTEFAETSGMEKTRLYASTFSARKVAEEGYDAMLAGKLDVFAGVTLVQRLMVFLFCFMPKRVQLRLVRRMQEV
jgi:short-subunit dehydrogenase